MQIFRVVNIVFLLWFVILSLFLLQSSHAARVSGLYGTEVVVVNQSDDERQRGFQLAMEDVLLKLTGDGAIAVRAEAAPVIRKAGRLVEEYRYTPIEQQLDAQPAEEASIKNNVGSSYRLYVRFSSALLGAELRNQNILVWGSERPSVIVWLAVENSADRMLISNMAESNERVELANQARRRALPLILPTMDQMDQQALSYADIRGGFVDKIRNASKRYRSTVMLAGHMSLRSGRWFTQWRLIDENNVQTWRVFGDDLNTAIGGGLEGLSNRLVVKYASGQHIAESAVVVRVNQISTLESYAGVMKYFSSLSVVSDVNIYQVSPDSTTFKLSLNGSKEDLQRIIALDPKLQPVDIDNESDVVGVGANLQLISYTLIH